MKLVRYGGGRTGLLVHGVGDGVVVDVAVNLPELLPADGGWATLIEDWPKQRAQLSALEAEAVSGSANGLHNLAETRLEAPLPDVRSRIYAMGGNFPAHVGGALGKLAMNVPASDAPPWGFYVIPGTVVGPDAEISPPPATQKLDYEAELCVVLTGRTGPDGGPEIWGYTGWNDFSIRDAAFGLSKVDHGPLTWSLQKNFTSANACGPCMVVDEPISDGVAIACRVNGELRQEGISTDMKFGFPEIVAHISEYLPFAPADMILSGTPSGTAMESGPDGPFLRDGDVTEVEVGDAGVLRNRVVLRGAAT